MIFVFTRNPYQFKLSKFGCTFLKLLPRGQNFSNLNLFDLQIKNIRNKLFLANIIFNYFRIYSSKFLLDDICFICNLYQFRYQSSNALFESSLNATSIYKFYHLVEFKQIKGVPFT